MPQRRKPPGDRGGGGSKPGPRPSPDKGGKKGGKKDGKKPSRRKTNRSDLYDRALRDIEFGIDPLLDEIRRAGEMAGDDYKKSSQRVEDIYGGLLQQLAPLTAQHTQNVGGYGTDLSNQIGGLASMLGSNVPGVPQEEITAGTGVVGSIGAGGLAQLASDRARNSAYNTSAIRQGGIEQATTSRNYLQDYQNFLSDLAQRRVDIKADMPLMLRTRMDELRDQQFQQRMAQKEFGLRAAAAEAQGASVDAFRDWVGGQVPRGNQGPGGPGGNNGPGGNRGGWQPTWEPGSNRPSSPPPRQPGAPYQDLMQGRSLWRDLGNFDQAQVRAMAPDRSQQIRNTYMRLFDNPYGQAQNNEAPPLMQMLKRIARRKAGG